MPFICANDLRKSFELKEREKKSDFINKAFLFLLKFHKKRISLLK